MPAELYLILYAFPHHTIQKNCRKPSYGTITELHLKLNTNVVPVHSYIYNGSQGLIYLTLEPSVFNTESTFDFITPVNPVQHPTNPSVSTGHHITELWIKKGRIQ